jgi:hypothetical protein
MLQDEVDCEFDIVDVVVVVFLWRQIEHTKNYIVFEFGRRLRM